MVVRNHSNTYQKGTIPSTKCVQCNGASLCKRYASNGSQASHQHANFFQPMATMARHQQCMETCASLGVPGARGSDLRRVRTAIGLPRTPAAKAAASASPKEHEDAKPTIGGLGTTGSESARRAALQWQNGSRRARVAARSERLRKEHT